MSAVELSSSAIARRSGLASGTVNAETRTPGNIQSQGSVSTAQARFTLDGPRCGGAGFCERSLDFRRSPRRERPSYVRGESGDHLIKLEAPALVDVSRCCDTTPVMRSARPYKPTMPPSQQASDAELLPMEQPVHRREWTAPSRRSSSAPSDGAQPPMPDRVDGSQRTAGDGVRPRRQRIPHHGETNRVAIDDDGRCTRRAQSHVVSNRLSARLHASLGNGSRAPSSRPPLRCARQRLARARH